MDDMTRAGVIASYDLATRQERARLDAIAAFAARLCHAPVGLVSLVDHDEQRFLGCSGTDLSATPREVSFCAHAMRDTAIMQVPDATRDARFADNPLVTGAPGIRFYAGAPLVSHDGVPIGALCVIDAKPRDGLDDFQAQGLTVLADAVMGILEARRTAGAQAMADTAAAATLADSETRFRTLADTMPQMVWSTLPDGYHDYYNARWYEFTGVPAGSTDGEAWNGMFHPDDQDRAWARWRHSLATGDPYQIEYRLRHHDGTYRWVLGRALPIRDGDGRITRWFGTCTDIHEQKLALEEREVISHELSHRTKNIFSVISGLIGFAARARPDFADVARDLRERITALGRAHDFVRPHSPASRASVQPDSLKGLLRELFAPYQGGEAERIALSGEDIAIDDRSATPLALLFHELATNATKYGALSNHGGQVALAITLDGDDAVLTWRELGGPLVTAPAGEGGFGSQLIELSAVRQLGGSVERLWNPSGLEVITRVPLAALSRR